MLSILEQFRNDVYSLFSQRADALMDLLDALSSNTTARSVVELSDNPLFRRQYSSVHDGIEHLYVPSSEDSRLQGRQEMEQALIRLLVPYLPGPQRPFRLLGTDVTSASRPFARTLSDRTFVYQPNPVKGVTPITIGHQYSVVALLPEKGSPAEPPWVIPLFVNRVPSTETKREAGQQQIARLLDDKTLPFHEELCVNVADSDYSAVTFLGKMVRHPNLITIARFAGNRTVYRTAPPAAKSPGKGHPTWFGDPMSLKDPETWDEPDETAQTTFTTRKGTRYTVHLEGWHDLLLRGKRGLPMHRSPLTFVRARVVDAQGKPVYARPMWLIVFGRRRQELSLVEIWDAYQQRYDLEHFFRFGKQRLLMDAYQTPETEREENWWTLAQLAYLQLWFAREQADNLPRPWERYLPRFRLNGTPADASPEDETASPSDASPEGEAVSSVPSPSAVQRDLSRILRQIGTPARASKRRGKAPGRSAGENVVLRVRVPVIKKSVPKHTSQKQQRAP
jgi:DDE superfamily endonuclease